MLTGAFTVVTSCEFSIGTVVNTANVVFASNSTVQCIVPLFPNVTNRVVTVRVSNSNSLQAFYMNPEAYSFYVSFNGSLDASSLGNAVGIPYNLGLPDQLTPNHGLLTSTMSAFSKKQRSRRSIASTATFSVLDQRASVDFRVTSNSVADFAELWMFNTTELNARVTLHNTGNVLYMTVSFVNGSITPTSTISCGYYPLTTSSDFRLRLMIVRPSRESDPWTLTAIFSQTDTTLCKSGVILDQFYPSSFFAKKYSTVVSHGNVETLGLARSLDTVTTEILIHRIVLDCQEGLCPGGQVASLYPPTISSPASVTSAVETSFFGTSTFTIIVGVASALIVFIIMLIMLTVVVVCMRKFFLKRQKQLVVRIPAETTNNLSIDVSSPVGRPKLRFKKLHPSSHSPGSSPTHHNTSHTFNDGWTIQDVDDDLSDEETHVHHPSPLHVPRNSPKPRGNNHNLLHDVLKRQAHDRRNSIDISFEDV